MPQSTPDAAEFYREVAQTGRLWCCRAADGTPHCVATRGGRAQPFWSNLPRVNQIIRRVPAYASCLPQELTWDDFLAQRVPQLMAQGIKVGLNWAGKRAVGFELEPQDLVAQVRQCMAENETRST
ncbi:MAG: DUF2750 domain-containing protein [Pirellulales bacterium]